MFSSIRWRSHTALLMALGFSATATLPMLLSGRAIASSVPVQVAQLFMQPSGVVIPSGTMIPVRFEEAEKIVVLPDETAPVTLIAAQDIRTSRGTTLIPEGSQIAGELRPTSRGTQFFAQEVILPNTGARYPIDAVSNVITDRETISRRDNPDFLRGAAIGAAAAAVLAEILGDIDFIEVLAGAGLGALASILFRGREEVEVVVIYPESDLDLTLQSDFALQPVVE